MRNQLPGCALADDQFEAPVGIELHRARIELHRARIELSAAPHRSVNGVAVDYCAEARALSGQIGLEQFADLAFRLLGHVVIGADHH